MTWIRKNFSNLLLIALILLLIVPQSRTFLQIHVNRLFSFAPTVLQEDNRKSLADYHWKLKELGGKEVNLSSSRGELIVINLWATWCPPCIAEMPSFEKLYQKYGDRVAFYFVSSEEKDELLGFLKKRNLNLPVYQAIGPAPTDLQSQTLPTTFVISPASELVVRKTGAADWNDDSFQQLLDQLLSEK